MEFVVSRRVGKFVHLRQTNVFVHFKFNQLQNQTWRDKGKKRNQIRRWSHCEAIWAAMLLQLAVCVQKGRGKAWMRRSRTWWSAWTPASPPLPSWSICSPWSHDRPAACQRGKVKGRETASGPEKVRKGRGVERKREHQLIRSLHQLNRRRAKHTSTQQFAKLEAKLIRDNSGH